STIPPTRTPVPPTHTPVPPTHTPIPPIHTPIPPAVPPTQTPVPPTHTPVPPTRTPLPPTLAPTATHTPVPATPVPSATQPSLKTTGTPSIDLHAIHYNNLTDPTVQAKIKQIYAGGKTQGVKPGDFRIVGDSTLVGLSGVDDKKANLAQFKAQMEPV